MLQINATAIRYSEGRLWILDQTRLPAEETWIESTSPRTMRDAIIALKVRGAPLIGAAAGLALVQYADQGHSVDQIGSAARLLREARPTAVNLMFWMDALQDSLKENPRNPTDALSKVVERLLHEDEELCQKMSEWGAALVNKEENILTYCNTGSLATMGVGTALGVIKTAHEQGKNIHVYACETRPLLQGARLTAWELKQAKIPHTLICDNMAGHLMSLGKISKIFVGADRIATNGDFANKIGTYTMAVLAAHHKIPFYVVAPYTTVDLDCASGKDIEIEQRSAEEVRGAQGSFGKVMWSPEGVNTYNPAFDVTPGTLVSGVILDRGVLTGPQMTKQGFVSLMN